MDGLFRDGWRRLLGNGARGVGRSAVITKGARSRWWRSCSGGDWDWAGRRRRGWVKV